uniref:Uncharacterized protein n=1 Tax=Salarias fasciatus TaxID=181472 RepID=A0A672IDL0_SALFA
MEVSVAQSEGLKTRRCVFVLWVSLCVSCVRPWPSAFLLSCFSSRATLTSGSRLEMGSGASSPSMSSNQSHGEYPDCRSERESGGEASLLVSPLVVAGIVIGLVLFLSCITIIVGSLRKDRPDGFSYGGSAGDLRSSCLEDFPPGLDFDSYRETLPPINRGCVVLLRYAFLKHTFT